MGLTQGAGAALILENRVYLAGITPKRAHIDKLVKWLATEVNKKVLSSRHLSKFFPQAVELKDVASGLLALEISRYNGDYLLFFKPEIIETRIWAGNPAKPTPGKEQRFHPRKSFEKGLGLYLTKMQIEKLGGEVSVQSEPIVGTTFTVSFPLHLDASASQTVTSEQLPLRSLRFLI